MGSKSISEPFQICSSITCSNNTVYVSSASSIKYRDTFSYQWVWSGASSTTFYIQTSNNYSPGTPQNPGSAQAGNWDSIPLSPVPTTSSATSYTAVVNQTGPAWARFLAETTSSGSFILSATFSAKSLGV